MMESDQKRAFLAVILSGLVLFGWQKYFAPTPKELVGTQIKREDKNSFKKISSENIAQTKINQVNGNKESNVEGESSKLIILKGENVKLSLVSDLSAVSITRNDLSLSSDELAGNDFNSFSIKMFDEESNTFKLINSKIIETNDRYVVLGLEDTKTLTIELTQNDFLNFKPNFPTKFIFELNSKKERLENGQVRLFKVLSDDVSEFDLSDSENFELKAQWFGLDFNYHLFAVTFKEKQSVVYSIKNKKEFANISAELTDVSPSGFSLVLAKKNYDELISLGNNLDKSVDFGVLGLLAVPILRGLQFFYNVFPNYGVSIIILTILIRLITFPLQYKSFKSMKKMSLLQPEINKLKDKFKDDPQRLQKETMELFKRSGANPLGGCLPMLLQMPIFFAFYKVLYAAVELVGQPFYFWINDLSEKDPYFVLPVILTVAMFFQQKLTPTTSTDPTQQKVMMFMPIIFGFIMKDMPSGLVLYICVSTIFQMAQQVFVNRAA